MLSSSGPSTNLSKPSFAACPTCRRRWISSAIFRTVHTSAGDHRHNRLRGHSLNFRLHMLSCAGATILSAFGGEVEKALGDRRGRPTWRSIANNWRRITRLDRPVPLSTAPSSSRGSLARHRGFRLASNHPSAQATPPGNSGGVFAFARSKSDATTLFGAGAQCPRRARHGAQNGPARAFKCPERTPANSPMRYLFRWTRIIQRHPVNVAR